jgi:pimeloyl-ACP methyl ester carboxylesterase
MPAATANTIEIAYEIEGPEDGPVALLIMGLAQQLTFWPPAFVEALNSAGFRTVRFDNRDIGKSERFDGRKAPNPILQLLGSVAGIRGVAPYSLEDMARDSVSLLDALGVDKAHIVGVSMGGMIAQVLAAEYPSRVASLTAIMSSTNNISLPRARPEITKALLTPPKKGATKDDVLDRSVQFWRMIGTKDSGTTDAELRARIEASYDRSHNPAGIRRQLAAIIDSGDLRRFTRKITAPSLVIHGSEDPLSPPTGGIDIAKNITGARLELIDGMGHDMPKKYLPLITEMIVGHMRANDLAVRTAQMAPR